MGSASPVGAFIPLARTKHLSAYEEISLQLTLNLCQKDLSYLYTYNLKELAKFSNSHQVF